jgi:hypothetical protein
MFLNVLLGDVEERMDEMFSTSDAKSTSGLCQHAKKCWGDATQNLEGACKVLVNMNLHDGSITAKFKCIEKAKSHCQHTLTEAR